MLMLKKKKALIFILAIVLALAGCGSSSEPQNTADSNTNTGDSAAPSQPKEVMNMTIGTASVGGMNYPIGMALAKIWNANIPEVRATAIATNGSPHNIDLLRTDDIDAAVARAIESNKAINGEEPYPEEMPWITAITGGLFYDANQILALKSSGIETIDNFKGKRIAVGPVGSGGEVDARDTLYAYGLTYDDIQPQYIEASQAIEMMEDGLVDGAILGLTMGASAVAELMISDKVVILPISDEAFVKLQEVSPYMQRRTLPANVYPNQDYEVATVGSPPDNIIAHRDLPEDLVYQMTKSIYENQHEMQSVAQVMENFGEGLIQEEEDMLLPYHPGTKKYFLEMGWITK